MKRTDLGETALVGWRDKVAARAAGPLSRKTPLSAAQARALIGAAFFGLSVYYVFGTAKRALDELR